MTRGQSGRGDYESLLSGRGGGGLGFCQDLRDLAKQSRGIFSVELVKDGTGHELDRSPKSIYAF